MGDQAIKRAVVLAAAAELARSQGAAQHKVVTVDLRSIGGSALTDDIDVPEAGGAGIPVTYVPARNTIMLSIALGWAEVLGADDLFCGVNAVDYSGYPDCRPEFFQAFENMLEVGTKRGVMGHPVRIEHPILKKTKAEIVKIGMKLEAPLHLTWSCYRGGERACGHCDSCLLRLKGFKEAGFEDPVPSED